jgi:hypothetical protein
MRPAIKAFIREYERSTTPHPTQRGWRLWRHQVALEVRSCYDQVLLRRIWAVKTNKGHGTACLRWLLRLIKKYSVEMIGHASNNFAGNAAKPSVMALRQWYKRFGAKFDRHGAFTFTVEGVRL